MRFPKIGSHQRDTSTRQDNAMSEIGPLLIHQERKLTEAFAPATLEVINESHLHAGHQPGFDGSGESHMRIRMVSARLNGMSRVAIHRAINEACSDAFERGLHALAIDAKGTE